MSILGQMLGQIGQFVSQRPTKEGGFEAMSRKVISISTDWHSQLMNIIVESSYIYISNSDKYSVYVGVLEPISTTMLAAKRVRMPHQLCIMCSIPIA